MKVIIQRVTRCSVSANGEVICSIGNGIFALIGITLNDCDTDVNYVVKKILNLRLFDEGRKKWCKNVVDKDFEVLIVSNFTLCHKLKGNRLDFHQAMPPDQAKGYYDKLMKKIRLSYKPDKIKDGLFGAQMTVELCNDGPVTIELNSNADPPNEPTKEK